MLIGVDWDGVLCDRRGFPREKNFEMCEPVKDAKEAINMLSKEHKIYVFTARNKNDREKIKRWLEICGFPKLKVTNRKIPGTKIYIDDRAIRFTNWLDVSKYIS